jgi:hypothetical protein
MVRRFSLIFKIFYDLDILNKFKYQVRKTIMNSQFLNTYYKFSHLSLKTFFATVSF